MNLTFSASWHRQKKRKENELITIIIIIIAVCKDSATWQFIKYTINTTQIITYTIYFICTPIFSNLLLVINKPKKPDAAIEENL